MDRVSGNADGYALGHSAQEQERLISQGDRFRRFTKPWMQQAGIGPGMRVLDAGCGVGDVAFIAADLVGPTGAVMGVDRSPDALTTARERAHSLGLPNVAFVEGDIAAISIDGAFDAVVGRLVLFWVADPVAVVRNLSGHVRPGGIVFFHEPDIFARAWPPAPLFEQCVSWIIQAFERSGGRPDMGLRLYKTLVDAGLPPPTVEIGGIVCDSHDRENLRLAVETVRSMQPAMEKHGIATAAELAVDTLEDRLRMEIEAGGGVTCRMIHYGA